MEKKNINRRIIIFSPNVSRTMGGISNTTYYLAKEFSLTHEVMVFTSLSCNEDVKNVKMYTSNKSNKLGVIVYQYNQLKRFLGSDNFDNTIVFCMSWRCALVPFLLKKKNKYVILCHGNEVLNSSKGFKDRFEGYLRKKIMDHSLLLFANSQYTCNLVKEISPNKDVKIIHPCSGEEVTQSFTNMENDETIILSIGRLEKRKGFQYVIRAVSSISKKFPDLKYYIAGEGLYRTVLEDEIKNNHVEKNCIMLGRITEEEKKDLLSKCKVLIMPSFLDESGSVEGFGIVFIEANAYGKPVIGTYSGGIPDAIIENKTGLLVKEHSVEDLTRAIDLILSNQFNVDKEECIRWAVKHNYREISREYLTELERLF